MNINITFTAICLLSIEYLGTQVRFIISEESFIAHRRLDGGLSCVSTLDDPSEMAWEK